MKLPEGESLLFLSFHVFPRRVFYRNFIPVPLEAGRVSR